MSNNTQDWLDDIDDDLDLEDDMFEEPQRSRRVSGDDTLKKVRRAERAKEKRIKELESELTSLRNFQRESVVKSVLNEKGVNPKIAKFIPADIEVTNESISAWIDQNADIFGLQPVNQSPISDEDLGALRSIDAATSNALSSEMQNDTMSALMNAQSTDEILSLIFGAEG